MSTRRIKIRGKLVSVGAHAGEHGEGELGAIVALGAEESQAACLAMVQAEGAAPVELLLDAEGVIAERYDGGEPRPPFAMERPDRIWWCEACGSPVSCWGGDATPPPRCPGCHESNSVAFKNCIGYFEEDGNV